MLSGLGRLAWLASFDLSVGSPFGGGKMSLVHSLGGDVSILAQLLRDAYGAFPDAV